MSLHNLETTVSPAEVAAISKLVVAAAKQLNTADKIEKRQALTHEEQLLLDAGNTAGAWVAAQHEALYEEWAKLPEGSHLKEAYANEVWTWSDRDLENMPDNPEPEGGWKAPKRPGA